MQRAINPLPDRLAFFWHRHWAISREEGASRSRGSLDYRNLLLRYADLGALPDATFRSTRVRHDTARRRDVAVPEHEPERQRQAERELRARVHGAVLPRPDRPGRRGQLQPDDVAGLAKAFTGWTLQGTDRRARPTARSRSRRAASSCGAKTFLGADDSPSRSPAQADASRAWARRAINAARRHGARAPQPRAVPDPQAVGGVHRQPDPAGDAGRLIAAYRGGGYQLKPLIRGDPRCTR